MSVSERLKYKIWCKTNPKVIKLGSKYAGTPRTKDWDISPVKASKFSEKFELGDLYFEIPLPEDILKPILND